MIPLPPLALIDVALRGVLLGLLSLLALALRRDRPRLAAARLGGWLALGLCVQVLSSTPWADAAIPLAWLAPGIAVSVANGVLFLLFVRALFDDEFVPRRRHAALWLAAAGLSFGNCMAAGAGPSPLLALTTGIQRLLPLVFALLAAAAALRRWRGDLVEGRRRLRLFIVLAGAGYSIAMMAVRLASPQGRLGEAESALDVAALTLIVGVVAARLLGMGRSELFPVASALPAAAPEPQPVQPGQAARAEPHAPASREAEAAADPQEERLAEALQRLMAEERAYRDEDLSVASLAARLGVPEYRLRRLINRRLGHRNFSAYVNGLRLEQVRSALADPAQRDAAILTLALDAGFQSIGPFNRAFKAATGLTPSEFRRARLADS